jgi:ribosome-associated protein
MEQTLQKTQQVRNSNSTVKVIKECKEFLDEKKAEDIIALDLMKVNSYLDYFVIVTASSRLHCRALASELQDFLRGKLMLRYMPEIDTGWVVLDYNEVIFHIFIQEQREYYNLEKLWADAEKI